MGLSAVQRFGRDEGRRLFGADPAGYDFARPGHADRVYEVLVERCGLRPGTSVLEVGPGTGQATRRLLELGAYPLVVLEPNPELAAYLRESLGGRIEIHETILEDAELPSGGFGLAAAASSFHWVEEEVGLVRILGALRPGGWFAMWWTLFGDRSKPDAFITATSPLLENLPASPTKGKEGRPSHGRDREARVAALDAAGFVDIEHELAAWDASWDTAGIRALYGSFSPILRLDDDSRTDLLDEIARIADQDFGGRVSRAITTALYTCRRPE
jgi:SAM-dependent methyltransferase